ncbi:6-chlorohydroxyquinol-1,2-dioxygenase [Streptomyces kunmingensis]|uniref:6-chlorohydroxyquinol-1,2-dioxygenase n=1 Tax=Streptomyces kunmingensis TaxID=68225 RepID=A0ABU6C4T0_9ACTN|nr:dioxygenase [Streptomyces kunmingensis]MEB3959622.1 6-chlorohydroxyquinol-1,2-dioxygenase [Streptomyces kunmingensis]
MATDFTEETATDAVIESFHATPEPRLKEVLTSLTQHLHAFVRDVRPTHSEWEQAIEFLTETGQKCDDVRQEFILLSDVLGVSMLVETINERETPGATSATVLGPFHVVDSPPRALGDTIDLIGTGHPCVVTGRVLSQDGSPLPGAVVDVWQGNEKGFYDVQQPGIQPLGNGRGLFTTDERGAFWFRTVVPSYYPIQTDGPVGRMLERTGRHPNRPAHIHFIVGAEGHAPVTTHVFVKDSPYIENDTVFAVKESLIADFVHTDDPDLAREHGVRNPFAHAQVDIVLESVSDMRPA